MPKQEIERNAGSEKTGVTRSAYDVTAKEEFARDDPSEEIRDAKVDANDGTTKAGLPEDEGNWASDNWDGKLEPAVSNAEACEPKARQETPASEHEKRNQKSQKFACKTGACSAASACLMACTKVASNSGEGRSGIAETAEVKLVTPTTSD